ncbi:hypothetical protein L916_05780 [Phytophthora nicotianae]|uniref:Uncharacterized protein n=1 Tax=Phytophthora nicotianae TaxID=4792 RepID=W2JBG7_PHYNI|nr:hypothetical protein L916_05780 [Phytophthora nicotianae]
MASSSRFSLVFAAYPAKDRLGRRPSSEVASVTSSEISGQH